MRVTSLMASAHAAEKIGWCRFYQPSIAIAINRQVSKGTRVSQLAVDRRSGGTVGGGVGCVFRSDRRLIDMRAQAEVSSALRTDTPTSLRDCLWHKGGQLGCHADSPSPR
jgi:hypothetical protein